MTKQQIIEKVHGLKTKVDLLNLLNELKREDLGDDCHKFNLNQLNFYCNPNHQPTQRYKTFTIPKKSGGVRTISSPRGSLKSMLAYLNVIFQAMYEPTEAAMGFVPGRSITDNATVHTGRKYVFNTDLKDFFPSVRQPRIWKMLQLKPFSMNQELASVIAGLCCMQDANGNGVLPQGSPCSPILTNIVCRNLDRRLQGVAKRFNLKYTRYADDITFSSDYNVFQEGSEFRKEFERIVEDQNFDINDKKTRLQKCGQRQEVTGLVVNQKVNVAKEYSRDLRSLLHIWKMYGKEQAYAKFYARYMSSKAYSRKKNTIPSMPAVITGKLLYMKMVMGENSTAYLSLRDKFLQLCPEQNTALKANLNYLASYRMDEFELAFGTRVEFAYKSQKTISGRSKTTGFFKLDEEKHNVAVNIRCDSMVDAYLSAPSEAELEKLKKRLYISLAERCNERFWLITIAPMDNVHKSAYQGVYKAKLRLDHSQEDVPFDIDDDTSVDDILSAFISSGFDFNTLEGWDKIKKN